MPAGNKGEWSEFYTLIKLLADGKVYACNQELVKNPNLFYIIRKILRTENEDSLIFSRDKHIKIIKNDNEVIGEIECSKFIEYSEMLLAGIKTGSGTFSIPGADEIFQKLNISRLSDNTIDKSDIRTIIYDPVTHSDSPLLGFSIKSYLGSKPTLFNASKATNIVYILKGSINDRIAETINSLSTYRERLNYLAENDIKLKFHDYFSSRFKNNLELIDSRLPEILAYMVLYKFHNNISSVSLLTDKLNEENPCKFNIEENNNFYSYKIKRFLVDCALGLTAQTLWTGIYDATGGFIVVKRDGDLVCFHLYNWNDFQNYLINNTKLDAPDSSPNRCDYGRVIIENSISSTPKFYFRLNFQIRFV